MSEISRNQAEIIFYLPSVVTQTNKILQSRSVALGQNVERGLAEVFSTRDLAYPDLLVKRTEDVLINVLVVLDVPTCPTGSERWAFACIATQGLRSTLGQAFVPSPFEPRCILRKFLGEPNASKEGRNKVQHG